MLNRAIVFEIALLLLAFSVCGAQELSARRTAQALTNQDVIEMVGLGSDGLMIDKVDRFARSVSHLLRALETFRSLGIEFVSLLCSAQSQHHLAHRSGRVHLLGQTRLYCPYIISTLTVCSRGNPPHRRSDQRTV